MDTCPRCKAYVQPEWDRCKICGRPRSYMRKFGTCRICFRNLALAGYVPGVTKASW